MYNVVLKNLRENKVSYAFLIPLLLFLFLVLWYPFIRGIWISFHEWPFMGQRVKWVGIQNYIWFLNSDLLFTSFIATLVYAGGILLQLLLALTAAIALHQKFVRLKFFWHGAFLIPYTMPPVVTGAIWLFLLDPDIGMIQHYLQEFGLISQPIYWMVQTWPARLVITWGLSWTFWPFMFVVIYAALQSIPDSHYEVAEIFGAGWWQKLRRITLPQVKNAMLVAVIIRLAWNMSKVSQVFQLTQGGPGYETSIFPVLMYRFAYYSNEFGKAYSIGIFLLIFVLIMILPVVRMVQKGLKKAY